MLRQPAVQPTDLLPAPAALDPYLSRVPLHLHTLTTEIMRQSVLIALLTGPVLVPPRRRVIVPHPGKRKREGCVRSQSGYTGA